MLFSVKNLLPIGCILGVIFYLVFLKEWKVETIGELVP